MFLKECLLKAGGFYPWFHMKRYSNSMSFVAVSQFNEVWNIDRMMQILLLHNNLIRTFPVDLFI